VRDIPTISVRISDEEKKAPRDYGPLPDAVRKGVRLYFQSRKTRKALDRLRVPSGDGSSQNNNS